MIFVVHALSQFVLAVSGCSLVLLKLLLYFTCFSGDGFHGFGSFPLVLSQNLALTSRMRLFNH